MCQEKLKGIRTSATYVVDTQKLKCLDDVKKDEFGMWNYSGSQRQAYRVHREDDGDFFVEKCAPNAKGDDIVYLRRLLHSSLKPGSEALDLFCFR